MASAGSGSSHSDATKVQHVNKKSSDELLRKFAEMDEEANAGGPKRAPSKKQRQPQRRVRKDDESPSSGLVERRSLLPVTTAKKSALLRPLGIHSRSQLKARDIRHKSLFCSIQKKWRRTVEGASKVFMEKHYNRHKRLINDMV